MSGTKWFLMLLLSLVVADVARCQDDTTFSTLSLSIGIKDIRSKDMFQSPYTYKGVQLAINSRYAIRRARREHSIDLTYSAGKMSSVVSPEGKNTLLLLNYDYLFDLKRKPGNSIFKPSVGMGLHALLNSANYLPEIELPVAYLSASAFLTLSGNVLVHVGKKSNIRIQACIPVLGVVHRPDFEINGKTLTEFAVTGSSGLWPVKLEYIRKFTSKLDFIATYHYNYFTFENPRNIAILQNGLLVGVKRKF